MYKTGEIKWKKINSTYWQKIYIGDSGFTNVSYHYKNKTAPACTVIEIETNISKQLSGYNLIEKDLRDSLLIYEEYLKLITPKMLAKDKILIKALVRAVVITYGKCFVQADGRKLKLKENEIPAQYVGVHKHLIKMRHQYVAHAGQGFEYSHNVLILPPEKKFVRGKIVQPGYFNEISQLVVASHFDIETKELLNLVHSQVEEKVQALNAMIWDSIKSIDPIKIYNFALGKGPRVSLNQYDFSSL